MDQASADTNQRSRANVLHILTGAAQSRDNLAATPSSQKITSSPCSYGDTAHLLRISGERAVSLTKSSSLSRPSPGDDNNYNFPLAPSNEASRIRTALAHEESSRLAHSHVDMAHPCRGLSGQPMARVTNLEMDRESSWESYWEPSQYLDDDNVKDLTRVSQDSYADTSVYSDEFGYPISIHSVRSFRMDKRSESNLRQGNSETGMRRYHTGSTAIRIESVPNPRRQDLDLPFPQTGTQGPKFLPPEHLSLAKLLACDEPAKFADVDIFLSGKLNRKTSQWGTDGSFPGAYSPTPSFKTCNSLDYMASRSQSAEGSPPRGSRMPHSSSKEVSRLSFRFRRNHSDAIHAQCQHFDRVRRSVSIAKRSKIGQGTEFQSLLGHIRSPRPRVSNLEFSESSNTFRTSRNENLDDRIEPHLWSPLNSIAAPEAVYSPRGTSLIVHHTMLTDDTTDICRSDSFGRLVQRGHSWPMERIQAAVDRYPNDGHHPRKGGPLTDEQMIAAEPRWRHFNDDDDAIVPDDLERQAGERPTLANCVRDGTTFAMATPEMIREQKQISARYFWRCAWCPLLAFGFGLGYVDRHVARATQGRILGTTAVDRRHALACALPLSLLGWTAIALIITMVVILVAR